MNHPFIDSFLCPHCQKPINIKVDDNIRDFICECGNCSLCNDDSGISLVVNLADELQAWVDINKHSEEFVLMKWSGGKIDKYLIRLNYIPNFSKPSMDLTMQAIDTLLTFK